MLKVLACVISFFLGALGFGSVSSLPASCSDWAVYDKLASLGGGNAVCKALGFGEEKCTGALQLACRRLSSGETSGRELDFSVRMAGEVGSFNEGIFKAGLVKLLKVLENEVRVTVLPSAPERRALQANEADEPDEPNEAGFLLLATVQDGGYAEECKSYSHAACTLTPYHVREMCASTTGWSYNPTVGVDSVSGGVKVTATFPLAPGLASKNSAANFLKGGGYDPSNFGMDILKYTFNSNKLWSVGERDYALPDSVSVYTAATACSMQMEQMTSAVASSADRSSSEGTKKGTGFSQSVDIKVPAGPATVSGTASMGVGFGRSSGTSNYEGTAKQGYSEEHRLRAKAVSFTATISTEGLTSCDLNEFFVTDVLTLAQTFEGGIGPTDDKLDSFLDKYGTHLPVKFEQGCEVSRTYSFSASTDSSTKQDSLQEASSKGFSAFGLGSKTETTSSEATSTGQSASAQSFQSATEISCGTGAPTLSEFCDSVVMNDEQSHLTKMLSVEQLVPVWSIMKQVDPWIGANVDQSDPEISLVSIELSAKAVADRFDELTSSGASSTCTTAGELQPPSEDGICSFTGKAWDCTKCSCYDTNFDPTDPAATPKSSCPRTSCTPIPFAKARRPSSGVSLARRNYLTLNECHEYCLRYPGYFGLPCGGFFFKPYDESTYENGACILYKETFTKQDVADFGGDEDTGAVYYQYSSRSNGCKPDFVPTKVVVNGYCSPNAIGGYYNDKGGGHTQAACFKMCEKNEGIQCAAASFDAPGGGRCILYAKEGCTDLEVPPNLNRVLKLWCGRAQVYEPTGQGRALIPLSGGNDAYAKGLTACVGECDEDKQCAVGLKCFQRQDGEPIPGCSGHTRQAVVPADWDYCYDPNYDPNSAEKKQCAADGSWYSSVDENCKEERVCASDEQLFYGACPWADPTLTKKAVEVPVGHAVPLSDLTTNFGKKKETGEERYNRISGTTEDKCREKIGTPLGGTAIQNRDIQVTYAQYGGNDNCASCSTNKCEDGALAESPTADLREECNTKQSCSYTVDYHTLGDPSSGCSKAYEYRYKCYEGGAEHSTIVEPEASGTIITLSCPAPGDGSEGANIVYAAFDDADNCHTYADNFGAALGDVHGATILAAWNYQTYGVPVRNACQGS